MMLRKPIFARVMALSAAAIAGCIFTSSADAQSTPPAARRAPANLGPPNALQGFSKNRGQPVQIEAATLEVRDKDKMATFSGNVHVIQGDTDMRSQTLVVLYEDAASAKASGVTAAQPGPGGSSQIKRLDALGNVIVTQKDQTATGDKGIFDMHANTVTLVGNVVISQGNDVMRGERLEVDMTTGASRILSKEGGRVQGIFQRGGRAEDSYPAKPGAK